MAIRTKEDFIDLCGKTNIPPDIINTFDGMDFLIWMNEYKRIVSKVELTNVRTYSFRLTAPSLYNYNIGYFKDIHNARLKVNRNWLKAEKDEQWWQERIEKIMRAVAEWVKRIFYMNAYEEKEKRLSAMRDELDKRGIQYIDDEEYQNAIKAPVKYGPNE